MRYDEETKVYQFGSKEEAIEVLIRYADCLDDDEVMYRHGVWNPYVAMTSQEVINKIERAPFDLVTMYERENKLFVSTPTKSDMW